MSSFWGFHYFELRLRLKMLMLFLNEHNWHSTKSVLLIVPFIYFRFFFIFSLFYSMLFSFVQALSNSPLKNSFRKVSPKNEVCDQSDNFPFFKVAENDSWDLMTTYFHFRFVSFSSFVKIIFAIHGAFSCKEISCGFSFSSLC